MSAGNGVKAGAPAQRSSMLPAGALTLADVMAAGPLPLPLAVTYAKEIAVAVAVFHRDGRAHGALAPAWILVGPHGAVLRQPSGTVQLATPSSDLSDFGLLLQQMLTGRDSGGCSAPASADDSLAPSPETVRAAALRLAERCSRAPGQADLRHVATELRLLQIMVNTFGANEIAAAAPRDDSKENPNAEPHPAESEKPRARTCPSCGSPKVFQAQHLTILEKALAVVDLKTYRCYGCCRRFINVLGLLLPRPEND